MTGADRRAAAAARHRLLPEGRVAGPMPWVIAIMMFLTVLAAAAGLGLAGAASRKIRSVLTKPTLTSWAWAKPMVRIDAVSSAAQRAIRG